MTKSDEGVLCSGELLPYAEALGVSILGRIGTYGRLIRIKVAPEDLKAMQALHALVEKETMCDNCEHQLDPDENYCRWC